MHVINKKRTDKRRTLGLLSATAMAAMLPAWSSAKDKNVLRIGFQKYGTLTLLKARGMLETRLAQQGVDVKWTEFAAGPVLLEALNVGSIDYGTVGEAPPIFAQAASADLVYVANEPPAPLAEAIIVPKGSTISSVAALKGKKIALNKGSNVHYLLLRALENAGVAYADVQTIFLPPADARAAFERGSVDAWVIWDPFLAAAERQLGARILADGKGLVSNHQFFLAARPYAEKNPEVLRAVLEELAKVDAWGKQNPKEVAALLSSQIGLEPAIVELATGRYAFGVQPITPEVLNEQQKIADAFANLKLIPKKIKVHDAVLATRS
ncbi:sulfonate transport system substrate-binding protein [Actimicrobium sp. GrIS 1.19]|uniref:sulfonate ABC transporter substrate-binding protein n=1 Tax=Actimicrobium sp. GrIS 1.19 TaxID=3071708 RepID=UPI002E084BCB|nr:sulfonate transport system substrate-binding protein [Actimicrobium sp. GrIS 1.19]